MHPRIAYRPRAIWLSHFPSRLCQRQKSSFWEPRDDVACHSTYNWHFQSVKWACV